MEPLHHELLLYEAARRRLGDAAVDGSSGPIVEWPYGRWALADHRSLIFEHFEKLGAIYREEARL